MFDGSLRGDAPPRLPAGATLTPTGADRDGEAGLRIETSDPVHRRVASWPGLRVEVLRTTGTAPQLTTLRSPVTCLALTEVLTRSDGETCIGDAHSSALKRVVDRISVIPPGHRFTASAVPTGPTCSTYVHIDGDRPGWAEAFGDARERLQPILYGEHDGLLATALRLKHLVEGEEAGGALYAEALATVLLMDLLQPTQEPQAPSRPARGGLSRWQHRRVCAHIDEHLAQEIRLAELAGLAGLSLFHFCRAFRTTAGVSPYRYIMIRRIERAKELLLDPALSVTEVGERVGYPDSSHFSTAFRKIASVSPSAFRKTY
ncbi:helix-turn-helix domain-containing protein [Salinarimonas soli]|uniref:Helix-turn-helix transcriptional regulator n=1 Tax=Salinarimonas soli TaxID=1638099 RepID=A0A5B2VAL6_9HYPH|nr:AraC family transcriptional regulator [Salinarimonas soli]KAA2236573.1 helix-turn-helix transcriptional regulator [Salinarimonas soli]